MQKQMNRYGNEYWFEQVEPNIYTIKGDLKYWRFIGKGQEKLKMDDLGAIDPSGGPWISIGCTVEGKEVTKIDASGEEILITVK